MSSPERRGGSTAVAIAISCAALAYAISVVVVAYRAPDKGFLAFTGRKVVDVTPGGPADNAGIRPGDVIVGIDGRHILSTADYIARLLSRSPGETVSLDLDRPGVTTPIRVDLAILPSAAPLPALAATLLAAVLLILGLFAKHVRPGDPVVRRFWRSTVVYAMLYAGALSWSNLLIHPVLATLFLATLFLAPPIALDFHFTFPSPAPQRRNWRRIAVYAVSISLLIACGAAALLAVSDYRDGLATDRGLVWTVRCITLLLALVVVGTAWGIGSQIRRYRDSEGTEKAQIKWLMFGFALATVPTFLSVPVAVASMPKFLLSGYRPFLVSVAILWFAANTLAVLRIRLADVDAVIHRSLVYAAASTAAVFIYLGVVLATGVLAERLGGGDLIPHVVAALAAATMFGPIRGRVTHWLNVRFFRDRVHYLQALRDLSTVAARLREPPDLAREVVEGSVEALRASSGALYLPDESWTDREPGESFVLMHKSGGDYEQRNTPAKLLNGAHEGISLPIGTPESPRGVLMFGPRLGGDLYSSQDRDLLAALAGQLAVSIENAKAFGTIAEMGRTLEKQNAEIRELRDRLEDENILLRAQLRRATDDDAIIGSSKAIRELRSHIELLAGTPASILLTGESGTGKGLIARTIHASSDRAAQSFVHVDCGAIPSGVFESELFGHERGAFTGAVRRRRGHFEIADAGTLFLDEIGELPLDLQPKLLRAVQEREFLRVGGSDPVSVDVRIIAATNRNLEDMVASGEFREDLYYRMRVVEVTVPPLRSRKADLPALIDHLLPRLCKRNHRPRLTISEDAAARLKDYGWPGNVRELENVLERAVVLAETREIQAEELALADAPAPADELIAGLKLDGKTPHEEFMEAIERRRLEAALRACGGNQSSAARKLGLARTTFINKLRRYNMI